MSDNLLRYAHDYADPDNPLTAGAPTWADAADWHARNLAQNWQAMQNPQTWIDAAHQYGNALLMGTTAPGIRAFHGSPYDFERFDAAKIGTGEGNQSFGYGLYLADKKDVAASYRRDLSGSTITHEGLSSDAARWVRDAAEQEPHLTADDLGEWARAHYNPDEGDDWPANRISSEVLSALEDGRLKVQENPGHLYEANIRADPHAMIDWDRPVPSDHLARQALIAAADKVADPATADNLRYFASSPHLSGAGAYHQLSKAMGGDVAASDFLRGAGIPGVRYLDGNSRGQGEGSSNYVIFDDKLVDILRKYGLAGMIAGGTGAIAGTQGNAGQ